MRRRLKLAWLTLRYGPKVATIEAIKGWDWPTLWTIHTLARMRYDKLIEDRTKMPQAQFVHLTSRDNL